MSAYRVITGYDWIGVVEAMAVTGLIALLDGLLSVGAPFLLEAAALAPSAHATHQGEAVLTASRDVPELEHWLVPGPGTDTNGEPAPACQGLSAALSTPKDGTFSVLWALNGPEDRIWKGRVSSHNGQARSVNVLYFSKPGDYRLSCTFTGDGAHSASVSWELTVDNSSNGPRGRAEYPSGPGTMVLIKGGSFLMGTPGAKKAGLGAGEGVVPERRVTVRDFYMGKYPVTMGEFCEFLDARGNPKDKYYWGRDKLMSVVESVGPGWGPVNFPEGDFPLVRQDGRYVVLWGNENRPVDLVTWFGATEYCKWLSEKTGKNYGLPTEEEWEYAARGSEGRKFPWGALDPVAAKRVEAYLGTFHASNVGSCPSNYTPGGIADLGVGVGEWCRDICPWRPRSNTSDTFSFSSPIPLPEYLYASSSASDWDSVDTAPRIIEGSIYPIGISTGWTFLLHPMEQRPNKTIMQAAKTMGLPPTVGEPGVGFRVVMEVDAGSTGE
jgi:formylglycine-generating enzyme required for sulfatase activity